VELVEEKPKPRVMPLLAPSARPKDLMCSHLTVRSHMATNLALDQDLLDHAFRVSGEPTKKAAVTRALQEFIARREQRQVAELFGKLEWDPGFDYKAERERQR
jgi:Arc/MetJ family transcription regulator